MSRDGEEERQQPKSRLWAALLRKLSVKHQSEHETPAGETPWKTERRVEDGVPAHTLDFVASHEKRHMIPRALSDVDEASESESGEKAAGSSPSVDKPRKSVSGKVAGFVGWKKSSTSKKVAESRSPMDEDHQ